MIVTRLLSSALALLTIGGLPMVGSARAEPGRRIDEHPGRRVYEDKCSRCHGADARGGKGPSLVPFDWSEEQALKMIRKPECDMPPFPATEISDAQVEQLVAYLKTLK